MLLQVKDLDISYGERLTVAGASLELDKGEIMSIVGESAPIILFHIHASYGFDCPSLRAASAPLCLSCMGYNRRC